MNNNYNTPLQNNDELDSGTPLVETLFLYLSHWKAYVLCLSLALLAAGSYLFITPKVYNPGLSILLDEDKGRRSSSEFADLDALRLLTTTNNLDNEIVVLKSPDLMDQVVQSAQLNISYYKKRRLRLHEIHQTSPLSIQIETPSGQFHGYCQLEVSHDKHGYKLEGSYQNGSERTFKQVTPHFPDSLELDTLTRLRLQPGTAPFEAGTHYFVKIRSSQAAALALAQHLSVSQSSKTSSVLNLSILVQNTPKGIDVLQEVVKQYNALNLRINNQMAYNTSLFINDRLKEIALELSDAEEEVVEYKQQHQITDLSTEAQTFVHQTSDTEKQLLEVETQLNVLKYIQDFIQKPENQTRIIPNLGVSDVGLTGIIAQYNNKLLAADPLLKGTGEQSPTRQRLLEELGNMRQGITGSLHNVRQTYLVSKADLKKQASTSQSRIRSVPKQEKGLIEKVREQKIKENLFLFLMQKREETNLSMAASSDKARIVVSPRSGAGPVSPKVQLILLAALLIGLGLPTLIIYLRQLLQIHIQSTAELEKLTGLSVVGEIGHNSNNTNLVGHQQRGELPEMFRSLRNQLKFVSTQNQGQTFLVTSTLAGEGKTFVSLNLALSFACTQKKVLLIGGDIRKPKLPEYLELSQGNQLQGLSDYLVDTSGQPYTHYLQQPLAAYPQFHFMAAGSIPPNPNELLLSPRLGELLHSLQANYDYILIDSAPVGLVSDSYLLASYAQATLYVVRANGTPKSAAPFISQQGKEGKLPKVYAVLNDSPDWGGHRYGYKYGYGYGSKHRYDAYYQ